MNFIKIYFFLIFALTISTISTTKILLDYNEELDIIIKDGKYYFQLSESKSLPKKKIFFLQLKIKKSEILKNKKSKKKLYVKKKW